MHIVSREGKQKEHCVLTRSCQAAMKQTKRLWEKQYAKTGKATDENLLSTL